MDLLKWHFPLKMCMEPAEPQTNKLIFIVRFQQIIIQPTHISHAECWRAIIISQTSTTLHGAFPKMHSNNRIKSWYFIENSNLLQLHFSLFSGHTATPTRRGTFERLNVSHRFPTNNYMPPFTHWYCYSLPGIMSLQYYYYEFELYVYSVSSSLRIEACASCFM